MKRLAIALMAACMAALTACSEARPSPALTASAVAPAQERVLSPENAALMEKLQRELGRTSMSMFWSVLARVSETYSTDEDAVLTLLRCPAAVRYYAATGDGPLEMLFAVDVAAPRGAKLSLGAALDMYIDLRLSGRDAGAASLVIATAIHRAIGGEGDPGSLVAIASKP